ncbi:MAG: MFS transporter [Candidatus Bathyarchaeia archaeon]|jgi:MFS family permease
MENKDAVNSDDQKPGFSRRFQNVIRLGYVSLFTDISTEMVLGVLPYFIVLDLHATAAVLGLIEGVAESVNDMFRVFSGVLTDRFGKRKPFVLIGYGLSTIAKPIFALTNSWTQVFAVRVVDRAGKGTRTSPRDALISDSISKSESGKGFGLHRSFDQIGAVVGPLLAFAVFPFIGFRGVFWVSFVPALIALLILVLYVADSKALPRHSSPFENARAVLTRDFSLLLVVLGIFSVGAYNYSFVLLKASLLGINQDDIAVVYATLNVATVIFGLPAGILADKIGKLPILCVSYVAFLATSFAGLWLVGYWAYAFFIAFLFGSYLAISETVQRAMIPDFTKAELKGTGYAIYYMLIGVGSLLANSIFGTLWTNINPASAFEYSIVTSTLGVVALSIFTISRRKSRAQAAIASSASGPTSTN